MFCRPLLTAMAVVGLCTAPYSFAHADGVCGTGYLEKFDRKGVPFCIAESAERTRALKQEQALRQKKQAWRANIIRDRRARYERQAKIEQRRRDRALN